MKLLQEGIIFLTYVLICSSLTKSVRSRKYMLCGVGTLTGVIFLLQAVLLIAGQDVTLVLTMLPVTAYLSFSVGLYLLTCFSFVQTTAVCTLGIFVVYILRILKKILVWSPWIKMPFPYGELLTACILLMAAGLLELLVLRFLRKPFHRCMEEKRSSWLWLFFPILMSFLLLSYFYNSVTNPTALILTLLTVLSVFLIVIRIMMSQAAIEYMKQEEQELREQMHRQIREYEDVCERMEAGRIYRHDMRHHLLVLEGLAVQSDLEGIRKYIQNMNGQLSDTEREAYCANSTVNAVLSACIGRAKEAGCAATAKINLPEMLPFDEMDICMVLANALENAINACRELPEEKDRYIHVSVEFLDRRRLIISIKNPCSTQVMFDEEGVPITVEPDGHGIGWKSIRTVIDKYNGFFQCKCESGEFCFQAALFGARQKELSTVEERKSMRKKLLSSVGILTAAIVVFLGCTPMVAQAIVGANGATVKVSGHSFRMNWGDTSFHAEIPVVEEVETGGMVLPEEPSDTEEPATVSADTEASVDTEVFLASLIYTETFPAVSTETEVSPAAPAETKAPVETEAPSHMQTFPAASVGIGVLPAVPSDTQAPPDLSAGVEEMNRQIEQYLKKMRERFLWYAARKYDGYVQSDITWRILRDDEVLLSVRYEDTINVGGSGQYSRCFTLDKRSGEVLELEDLFVKGSDYVGVISAEILRQMTERVRRGEGDYFIPGSTWGEEDWFREIAPDQNFYINDQNCLVIVFDEYEVGPGIMGMPEFIIDTKVLKGILTTGGA